MNIPDIQNHCNSKHEQHQCDNYDRNYYGSTFVWYPKEKNDKYNYIIVQKYEYIITIVLKKTIKFTNIYTFKKHEYKSWNINWISRNWKIKIIQYQKPNQLSEKNPNQLSEKNG